MLTHEHEALIQGAIDGTLTDQEREAYRRLMAESAEAQNRAAQLEQLTSLIESLDQAEAPSRLADEVIRQVSSSARREPVSQFVPRANPRRGVAVNKNLIFGLAAAAVVILAVITYTSYPPATDGTEATIGAAQRAQAPQIAPQDVALGDASAQEFLQSELFDELINDEATRTMLQDAEIRKNLADPELRRALEDQAVREALRRPDVKKLLEDPELGKKLDDVEARKRLVDANARKAFENEAFARALKNPEARRVMARAGFAEMMARPAVHKALEARGFEAALRRTNFAEEMARAEARNQARAQQARGAKK
jgi:hypothetical protein